MHCSITRFGLSQQPDLGNILILFVTFTVLFVAHVPIRFLALFVVGALSAVISSIYCTPTKWNALKSF